MLGNDITESLFGEVRPIYGSRVQASAPPVSEWTLIIRNHSRRIIPWKTYVDAAAQEAAINEDWEGAERPMAGWDEAIIGAIRQHRNIIVAGADSSGKTTALNTLNAEHAKMFPEERLVVVQDRREIVPCLDDHIVIMARVEQSRPGANGTSSRYMYEFGDAGEDAMRCDGDTLVCGEVRDPLSAIGLVGATNTGLRAIQATIHARSAEDVPTRLEELVLDGGRQPIRRRVAKMCELIIYMQRSEIDRVRRIVDVVRVLGVDSQERYRFERVAPVAR